MDQSQEILKYLDIAKKRKYWIVIPFLVSILGGLGFSLGLPKVYEAETLILVLPQKVPTRLVTPIVETGIIDRLKTMMEQVKSRTNLEAVIKQYDLYGDTNMALGNKVHYFRSQIEINIHKGSEGESAFRISFRYKDPKKVSDVTNTLASNFLEQNLQARESQAFGTSSFLGDELESVKKKLLEKEEELKEYRTKYMGGLPNQLETNLRILERLQLQLQQLSLNLANAENRKIVVQKAMAEKEQSRANVVLSRSSQGEETRDLESLRSELASLEARYTEKHPDVIRLKKMIAKLEVGEPEISGNGVEGESATPNADQRLVPELRDIELEIKNLKAEIGRVESQIKWYEKKVEETPKREQELLSLERDYGNLQELYDSLMSRKLEADISVSMERKQKGEQFRVIDPAIVPKQPVSPDVQKIFLIAAAVGLGLGAGLAYFMEMMDTSYRNPDEVEKELKVPVLLSISVRHTEKEIKTLRIKETLKAGSVAVGFVVCAVGVVLATKGVDKTVQYIKTVLERI